MTNLIISTPPIRSMAVVALLLTTALTHTTALGQRSKRTECKASVPRCNDFKINGRGDCVEWKKAEWIMLNRRGGPQDYRSRFKMMYSDRGVYVLFDGQDRVITATMREDFSDLWKEDVFECFFWTDENHPVYFEYEISPLGVELPIMVPQLNGKFLGWRPWHYDGDRKIQKQVSATGGVNKSGGFVDNWRAEVFIPYKLLAPLGNVPPKPGTQWRANFYRMDYDDKKVASWDWARVGSSFHEVDKFGVLSFE